MGQFIFRFPGSTPGMTYQSLRAYVARGRSKYERKVGRTVTLTSYEDCVRVKLYDTTIAYLYANGVQFTEGAQDRHITTGTWLDKIARDNGLGMVYQENWVRKIKGVRIAGRTFPLADARA